MHSGWESHKASKAVLHADEALSTAIWIYDLISPTVDDRGLLPLPFWKTLAIYLYLLKVDPCFYFIFNICLLATIHFIGAIRSMVCN